MRRGVVAGAIAPGRPTATRFCVYGRGRVVSRGVYRGGPLDRALNGTRSRFPRDTACAGAGTLPVVVVLTYAHAAPRHVVVDVGGCSLTTSTGAQRVLLDGLVASFYTRAFTAAS